MGLSEFGTVERLSGCEGCARQNTHLNFEDKHMSSGDDINWIAFAGLLITGVTTLGGVVFGLLKYITTVKDELRSQMDALRADKQRKIEVARKEGANQIERLESDLRKAIEHNKGDVLRENKDLREQMSGLRQELEGKLHRLDDRVYKMVEEKDE